MITQSMRDAIYHPRLWDQRRENWKAQCRSSSRRSFVETTQPSTISEPRIPLNAIDRSDLW